MPQSVLRIRIDADPDHVCHLHADPDPSFHFDADANPDTTLHIDADPDPSFQIKVQSPLKPWKSSQIDSYYILACHLKTDVDPDPDQAYHIDAVAVPDPTFHFDADPCGNGSGSTTLSKVLSAKNFSRIPGHCDQTALQYFINWQHAKQLKNFFTIGCLKKKIPDTGTPGTGTLFSMWFRQL